MKKLEKRNRLQSVTAFATARHICSQACVAKASDNNGTPPAYVCGREDSQYAAIIAPYENYYMIGGITA